jgi:opacity protein-like surface antigen
MSLTTRAFIARKGAILGSAALALGLFGSSGAWAQCTDNFNFRANNVPSPGQFAPVSVLAPLGTGSSLSAFISTINSVNTAFLTNTSAFVSAPGGAQPDQQGGGVWGRVIAGTAETKTSSTGTIDVSALGLTPDTGRQTCHTTTRQDYAGYQVGHDISVLNGGGTGANWHWGVTAGYFEAKTKDKTPAGAYTNPNFPADPFTTPAGTFSAETQVPFVGIYTAFTKGSFFLDGQVRVDFYTNSLSDSANGLFGQQLDARGLSLTANAGYSIPLGSGWFIEPSAGVVWSRVEVDPLNVAGVLQTGAPFAPYARGTVTVEDIDSLLGRASFTVGTNFTSRGVAWQPYFTASVFNEFAGSVTARSVVANTGNPALDGLRLTTSTDRVGTYGQFALGTAAAIINTGWLGYTRVDYKVGEDIDGWSVNAGLRYQFTPDPRRGSIKDAPVTAWHEYNWTGAYVGGFAGTTWGDQHWLTQPINTRDDPDFRGYLLGGQAGYNVQVGKIVYGIEGDYGWSNAKGGKACTGGAAPFFFTCEAEVNSLASLTGRVGHTWGRALFYVKGGLAAGEATVQTSNNRNLPVPPSNTPVNGESNWQLGWTLGGGMEFALTDRWSAKAEYMYYDLGQESYRIDNNLIADAETRGSTVRIGVNYHFGPRCCEAPLK